ncbi:MAG: aminotransferase class I/II-fold pyridoxal phosphate-dependent enzyme, partial [Acidimicrobiia bacterium]
MMSDPEIIERIGGRSDLADLQAYRAPQIEAQIRLNTNESPYPPPESFLEDLANRLGTLSLNRYPDREAFEFRQALAAHAGTITERVWAANGSNEILLQTLLAFGGTERKAMTFEPTYAMHSHIIRISETRLLRARRNPDFTMDLDASVSAVRAQEPDIVFMCSPNNPTGNPNSEEEIDAICETSSSRGGLVILDEAYAEFAGWN